MALTGNNGDNETSIGLSSSIGLTFYDEMTKKELNIYDLQKPIEFWIKKENDQGESYQFFNGLSFNLNFNQSNLTNSTNLKIQIIQSSFYFVKYSFYKTKSNTSFQIQLKPNNKSISYLILLKYSSLPVLNSFQSEYDDWKIFCSFKDFKINNITNESYYSLFENNSKAKKDYTGLIGFSIRELDEHEVSLYCEGLNLNNTKPPIKNLTYLENSTVVFKDNFWIKVSLIGCYYLDKSTNKWSSYGMEILEDTNETHTHCISNHLTEFAGGYVVLPAQINFDNVWANASFDKNPTIFLTVIILTSCYFILAAMAVYKDRKDKMKTGFTLLFDLNDKFGTCDKDNYFYEAIVFTGNRKNSETDSNV